MELYFFAQLKRPLNRIAFDHELTRVSSHRNTTNIQVLPQETYGSKIFQQISMENWDQMSSVAQKSLETVVSCYKNKARLLSVMQKLLWQCHYFYLLFFLLIFTFTSSQFRQQHIKELVPLIGPHSIFHPDPPPPPYGWCSVLETPSIAAGGYGQKME